MIASLNSARIALSEYYKDDAPVMVLLNDAIFRLEHLPSFLACEIEAEVYEKQVLPALRRAGVL